MLGIYPRATGCEAQIMPLCYAAPLWSKSFKHHCHHRHHLSIEDNCTLSSPPLSLTHTLSYPLIHSKQIHYVSLISFSYTRTPSFSYHSRSYKLPLFHTHPHPHTHTFSVSLLLFLSWDVWNVVPRGNFKKIGQTDDGNHQMKKNCP